MQVFIKGFSPAAGAFAGTGDGIRVTWGGSVTCLPQCAPGFITECLNYVTLITNMETGRVESSLLPVVLRYGADYLRVESTITVEMQPSLFAPYPPHLHYSGANGYTYTVSGEFVISVDRARLVKNALFSTVPRPVVIAVNWAERNE
jgi:hypothetical protein